MPDEALMDEAMAMAEHFAVAPTKGLAFTKKALQASYANTLPEQLKLEGEMMRELGYSHDYREGVAAFIAKRPAALQGRISMAQALEKGSVVAVIGSGAMGSGIAQVAASRRPPGAPVRHPRRKRSPRRSPTSARSTASWSKRAA